MKMTQFTNSHVVSILFSAVKLVVLLAFGLFCVQSWAQVLSFIFITVFCAAVKVIDRIGCANSVY